MLSSILQRFPQQHSGGMIIIITKKKIKNVTSLEQNTAMLRTSEPSTGLKAETEDVPESTRQEESDLPRSRK